MNEVLEALSVIGETEEVWKLADEIEINQDVLYQELIDNYRDEFNVEDLNDGIILPHTEIVWEVNLNHVAQKISNISKIFFLLKKNIFEIRGSRPKLFKNQTMGYWVEVYNYNKIIEAWGRRQVCIVYWDTKKAALIKLFSNSSFRKIVFDKIVEDS